MKRFLQLLAAAGSMLIIVTASPAWAVPTFVKTTVNNASGNQTPNALVSGWFEYNLGGDVTIFAPTNSSNGQLVMFTFHDDATHTVTWSEDYQGQGLNGEGYFGGWQGLFFVDGGTIHLIYGQAY